MCHADRNARKMIIGNILYKSPVMRNAQSFMQCSHMPSVTLLVMDEPDGLADALMFDLSGVV